MIEILQAQSDDSSYDELMRALIFAQMIERGLEEVERDQTVSHEEILREIKQSSSAS